MRLDVIHLTDRCEIGCGALWFSMFWLFSFGLDSHFAIVESKPVFDANFTRFTCGWLIVKRKTNEFCISIQLQIIWLEKGAIEIWVRMAEKSYDLSTFQLERILTNSSKTKTICVLGKFPSADSSQPAIVVLEKTAFTEDDVSTLDDDGAQRKFFSLETQIKQEFINDIYGNFQCYPIPAINSNFHISLY